MSHELGRLAQGNIYEVKEIDTVDFIYKDVVHANQPITYTNFICDYRPLKSEMYRINLVAGCNKVKYDGDAGTPADSLIENKLLINSVISDAKRGAKYLSCDLKASV